MKHKKILASLLASLCLVSFGLSNFVSTNIPGVSIVVRADSNEEYVRAFVNRMYNIVLEREAEQEGLDVWTHEILSGSKTGAQLVEAFFFSDEFLNKDKSDADFLDLLYLATFNRDADAKGKENWLSQIDAGMSRREVINEFIISPEFAAICNNYGITAGTINLEENVNSKREYATSFVKRMYNIVLNREAEPDGLKVWTNEITTGSKTGAQLVEAFFFSDEFLGKNTTNSEFLDLLYLATFNREADAAGKANWLAHLDRDMTRRNVINEFVTSPEFANICKKYDITAGSLTLDNGLDKTKQSIFSKIAHAVAGRSTIDDDVLDNLEEILVTSDVGVETTLKIIERIQDRVAKDKYVGTDELNELLRQEITDLLVSNQREELDGFNVREGIKRPYVILVVGVNGVGKTTTIGKLAHQFKKSGNKVILGAADTFRAAAIDQLQIWGDRVGVPVVRQEMGSDPASVAFDAVSHAVKENADVVIIDTAGRLHNKVGLMNELGKIRKVITKVVPEATPEVLLVLDGSTGQNAYEQAKQFAAVTDVTALAITKLDGTAKGGVVIGISDQLQTPVRYIGLGEGMDDLQIFNNRAFVDSLFGK